MKKTPTMQQLIQGLSGRPEVNSFLDTWLKQQQAVINEALTIQTIPAPTFAEQARMNYIEAVFRDVGLADIKQDDVGNVYGRTPGRRPGSPALLISAHADTVFPIDTDLTTRQDGIRIYGPGLGDNSLGVAGMLGLLRQMTAAGLMPDCDIWWVVTVGEEGLGDLRGMRQAFKQLDGQIGAAIILEGIGLGHIYHAGLGVRRLRVSVQGEGGHSWLHAQRPSAIHHILRLGAALVDQVELTDNPRTTLNIGLISGGTSINTRAPQASLAIDLRANDPGALENLESQVMAVVRRFSDADSLTVSTDVIGDRPSARLPGEHPLVRAAQATLETIGRAPVELDTGSTDANIPLSLGVPAVCISLTKGGNAHTSEEFIEIDALPTGLHHFALLTLLTTANIEPWSKWEAVYPTH